MPPLALSPEKIVTIDELAGRWRTSPRRVVFAMTRGDPSKRLGYYVLGGVQRVTSEAMIASYLAANLVNPPRALPRTSILENDARERAFKLLEELVRTGHVRVTDRCPVHLDHAPHEAA